MNRKFRWGRLFTRVLQAMAMVDPYCYYLADKMHGSPTEWAGEVAPRHAATKAPASPQRSWGPETQP